MRLVDLVRIDHRFEKSVNLLLDLNDESKLKLYIPTRSSIKLLAEYLEEVAGVYEGPPSTDHHMFLWARMESLRNCR